LLAKDRFALVYNAVDRSRVLTDACRAAEFRRRYGVPADRIVVVQVSWMIPEKGIQTLLKTAQLLLTQNKKAHFVLVGEGNYRQQFMDEAVQLGIADHVSWTGLIEDPIAAGVYDAADIVCQLSQWEELFGWMIAEGMAHGKPIVATRVGGIPELVTDGVSGFLVERDDAREAAEKLQLLIENESLRREMGQAGRELVAKKFDLTANVAQLVELYEW
jgi:glycosyltransferase involved in cell wall biosynthesis